jgi:hypothetical protein
MARYTTGLFGSKAQTQAPATALRVNTSIQGVPVPLLLGGRARVAGNLMDYFGLISYAASSQQGGGGGKGGSLSPTSSQGASYAYSVNFLLGLCEGPIDSIWSVYINGSGPTIDTIYDPEYFLGDYAQVYWGIETPSYGFGGRQPLGYRGVAYAAWAGYPLGTQPTLPNINVEIQSTNNGFLPGQPDGDPTVAWTQFLTNAYWGLGFPSARMGSLATWQSYCKATGFAVSAVIASPVQAASFCNDLLTATNAAACWQDGLMTVVPYGDTAVTAGQIFNITEPHTIPAGGTNVTYVTIVVGNSGTFVADLGVAYANGVPLTPTDFPPAQFEYWPAGPGQYIFNVADSGQSINITYSYAAAASYVPPTTDLYDFTIDDMLPNKGTIGSGAAAANSPLIVVRKPRDQMLNDIKTEYLDRSNNYNPVNIERKDSASITTYGRVRPSDIKQLHMFALASAAVQSTQLQLARAQIPRTFQWTVGKHFVMILELMAVVTVTRPPQGLYRQPVRIIEIQENADQSLTITAEEFPGTASAPIYGTQASAGTQLNYNASPGSVNPPIVFEPTDELGAALISGGGLMIAAAVSGANTALWGGCQVWASYDGTNYQQVGTIQGAARMGVLIATLPSVSVSPTGQTIDAADTLAVDLTQSAGTLSSGTQLDATSLNTRCFIGPALGNLQSPFSSGFSSGFGFGPTGGNGGEIIAYQTATLTAASKYNLTYLVRGAYGTEDNIAAWPAGTPFARLDAGIFAFPYDSSRIGATLYLKFCSFNIYQGGVQSLSQAAAYTYQITGSALASPLPAVANLTTAYTSGRIALSWDEISDFRNGIRYEIRQGATFAGGLSLGTVAHPPFVLPGNGTFWISAWCQPAASLIVRSETAVSITVAGSTVVTNEVASYDCRANGWAGTFTGGAGVDSGLDAARSGGAGNFLSIANVLTVADILNYGGEQSGTYSPNFFVNIGRVAPATITISMQGTGQPIGNNFLTVANVLTLADVLGSASAAYVDVYPEVLVAQSGVGSILSATNVLTVTDFLNYGIPYAAPQKYIPGDYVGQVFAFTFPLDTVDPGTEALLLEAVISVQVPDRVDNILTNATLPAAGQMFTFTPDGAGSAAAFNGGPNGALVPQIIASWGDEQAGDVLSVPAGQLSLTGCFVQILNGGVGVQRNAVNLFARGY